MPTLRRASPDDIEGIVTVFLDCWQVSYSLVMPAALVDNMTPERAQTLWQNALDNPDTALMVAVSDAPANTVIGLVGYSLLDGDTGYVGSLYVSPFAQGSGTGRMLLTAATDDLEQRGAHEAQLWVFERNEPSRKFYERQGWKADGRRETLADWDEPQIGMTKHLPS